MATTAGDILVLLASIAQLIGGISLICCGDASQLSLKMIKLLFFVHLLRFPWTSLTIEDILLYGLSILCFLFIFYAFRTKGWAFHETYRSRLDSFPRIAFWFLPVIALPIPLVFFFLVENGIHGCTPHTFEFIPGVCTMYIIWGWAGCLEPLCFLPQLLIMYKLSKEGKKLKGNIRLFFFLEMVAAILIFLLAIFDAAFSTRYFVWSDIATQPLIVFLVGHKFILNCLRGKDTFQDEDDEEEVVGTNSPSGKKDKKSSTESTKLETMSNDEEQFANPSGRNVAASDPQIQVGGSGSNLSGTQTETKKQNSSRFAFSNPFKTKDSKSNEEKKAATTTADFSTSWLV